MKEMEAKTENRYEYRKPQEKRKQMIAPDLFEFAYVPDWYGHLAELERLALPESWKFRKPSRETKNADTPILERYIHTIFRKQVIDFNSESDPRKADSIFHLENECVCFHTGLYTPQYKGIYGYFEINNISAFSFEIPELVDWLKINSVSIGFTEANELFAIEEKIEPIIIKKENPHIEISFGPASPFMPPEINDRVEYVVKNYPRVHVSYEEMVTDERVYADIQILMRFFGMLIGYVSYAKDIRLNIEGKDLKTWIWFNEDFSHNLRHLNGIDRFRTEYSQVKDELTNYFENWYTFSNDDYFFLPRQMFFNSNRKREIFAEDLFVQYVKILEGYHLRISGDEKKAEQLGIDILEQLKDENVKKVLSEPFKKAGSSYKPKTVAQWIQGGFLSRITLETRLKKLDEEHGAVVAGNTEYVYKESNADKYFSAIVKTRNYYSHYKPDRDGVLTFGQMCNSIDVLKCLIIMILFSHMGMDIDTAKQIMIHDDKLWMYTSCMKKDEDIEG